MSVPANSLPQTLIRPVMPELDSLRGIAILVVLFFHGFGIANATNMPRPLRMFIIATMGGWSGVYLFFVLSGFLITGILLDSKAKPDYYRRFYIRRALRILPAFYLLLLVLWIVPRTGILYGRQVGWRFLTLSFFYLANVTTIFGVPAQYTALWSLAVEEHFYLAWPTAIRALSRRAAAYCAAGIFVATPIIRAITFKSGHDAGAGYTWLVADGLALGALIGILSRGPWGERTRMRWISIACFAAAIALFVVGAPFGIWRASFFAGAMLRRTAVDLFYAGLLVATLLLGTSRLKWIVNRPVLRWFGEISYGLYLIHMLAFDFVDHCLVRYFPNTFLMIPSHFGLLCMRFLVAAALASGIAYLSRRYFEEPFLRLKDRWTAPKRPRAPVSVPAMTEAVERSA